MKQKERPWNLVFLFNYCCSLRERGGTPGQLGTRNQLLRPTSLAYQTPLKKENTLHFSGCCQTAPSEGLGRAPCQGTEGRCVLWLCPAQASTKIKESKGDSLPPFCVLGGYRHSSPHYWRLVLRSAWNKAFVCVLRVLCQFLSLGLGRSGK